MANADKCVICDDIVPKGRQLCKRHQEELNRPPDMSCILCPDEDTDRCKTCDKG